MAPTKQSPNTDEKIIFKCNKHSAIISEKLQTFYAENEFFDTVLIAGSNCVNIQAHKVVLLALSEYFLKIFRESQSTLKENVIELKEIEASTLKLVIDFMYSGEIELSLQTVEGFLRTASFLKLKTLVDGCCEFIERCINYRNSLYWFRLAKELSLATLKAKSLECIYIHFEKIWKNEELLTLGEIELKDLLFNDNPHGDFEEEIFLSMVAWINYDKPNRERLIFELLSMVRFWVLTPKFIVENRKSVCNSVESYELFWSWVQWHLSPETRSNNQPNTALTPRKKPKLAIVSSYLSDDQDRKICIQTFNQKKNSWPTEKENRFASAKEDFSSIVIDGKLIMVGGRVGDGWKNSVECFDLNTSEWSDLPPMLNLPTQTCKLAGLNGQLCVFAECEDEDSDSFSMQMYNFSTCEWNDVQPPCLPSEGSQIAAFNGVLYILDFNNGYLQTYDASSNKWTSRTIKKDSLKNFGLTAFEGFLYVFGGVRDVEDNTDEEDDEEDDEEEKDVEDVAALRYDLSNDTWCEMAPLPYVQATSFINSKVFENKIIACDCVNVAEYDLEAGVWNTLCPISDSVSNYSFDICTFTV